MLSMKVWRKVKRTIFKYIQIFYPQYFILLLQKFILLLQKGVYPYEYMDDWQNFNHTSLPEKKDFYSHLNKGDVADADYAQAKNARTSL